jgi:TonB-dependent SusC/RagA subfamily outer membrane receptor
MDLTVNFMKTPSLIIPILILLLSHIVSAQNIVVSGTVTAYNRFPLKNVKVEAKKAGSAVKTDSLGCYRIVCAEKDRLTFSAEVFISVTRRVNLKTDTININMIFQEGKKNEELAVGYGYMNQKDITYAVAQLTDENNDFANYTDIYSLIQGKFAGVSVVYDHDGPKIYIRGIKTGVTETCALILVNGQAVTDISYLSPSHVKSIDVLKDAASTIYGNRGANGVVLITTR